MQLDQLIFQLIDRVFLAGDVASEVEMILLNRDQNQTHQTQQSDDETESNMHEGSYLKSASSLAICTRLASFGSLSSIPIFSCGASLSTFWFKS